MGWRDVQAGVASGAIDYRKKPDKFGSFLEGFASVYAPAMQRKAEKEDAAETLAAKELKAQKKAEEVERKARLTEARKAAEAEEKQQKQYEKSAKAVLSTININATDQGYSRAFNKAFSMLDGGRTVEGTIEFFAEQLKTGAMVTNAPEVQGPMPPVQSMDAFDPLVQREAGAGGLDALLNQSQNSQFASTKVSEMTLGKVLEFQLERGGASYHAYSKDNMPAGTEASKLGLGSTPVGKYQFVGSTMEDMQKRAFKTLKFDENTIFNEETQDALFVWLAKDKMTGASTQEEKRAALRGGWEGIRDKTEVTDAQVDEMIEGIETGTFSSDGILRTDDAAGGDGTIYELGSPILNEGQTVTMVRREQTKAPGALGSGEAGEYKITQRIQGTIDAEGYLTFSNGKKSLNKFSELSDIAYNYKDMGIQEVFLSDKAGNPIQTDQVEAQRPESMEGGIFFNDPKQVFDLAPFISKSDSPGNVVAQRSLIEMELSSSNKPPEEIAAILANYDKNPFVIQVLADIPNEREIAAMSVDDLIGFKSVYEANALQTGDDTSPEKIAALELITTTLADKQNLAKSSKALTPKAAWIKATYPDGFETPGDAVAAETAWKQLTKNTVTAPPTSLSALKTSILMKSPGWDQKSTEEQQAAIVALENTAPTTLTQGAIRQRHLEATLASTSTDPKIRAAAALYLNVTFPAEMASFEAVAVSSDTDPQPMIANINGVDTSVVLVKGQVFRLEDTQYKTPITPQSTDNANGYTSLTSEALSKAGDSRVTAASQPIDAQRKKMAAAISVTKQGFELEKLARKYPGVLTATGKGQSLFTSAKTELSALLDIIGAAGGDAAITQDTVLNDIQKYLDESSLSKQQSQVFYEFASASTLYIFAAGKALGQEGNGFSNQDYNNIRSGLLSSNNIEAFSASLRSFAHRAITGADEGAFQLRTGTAVTEMKRKGRSLGSEGMTALELLASQREGNPNLPEYTKWANPEVDFTIDVQPVSLDAPAGAVPGTPPKVEVLTPEELDNQYRAGTPIVVTEALMAYYRQKYANSPNNLEYINTFTVGDQITLEGPR